MRAPAGAEWGHPVAEVAEVAVDPARAEVYAEGWQSWTPSTTYRLADVQARPARPATWVSGYGGSRPQPPVGPGRFAGDGLLVLDPGTGGDVLAIGAPSAGAPIAAVRCHPVDSRRLVVRADAEVVVRATPAEAGVAGGLAGFADDFAAASGVGPIRSAPTLWCSWYQYFTDVTEADLLENLEAIDRLHLPVEVVQLDDGYQSGIGDWLSLSARFDSLPGLVDRIRSTGRRAGIWIAPFLAGARSDLAATRPEWLLRGRAGEPVLALHNWDQDVYALDPTAPGLREHLSGVLRHFRDIGIELFKVDFLYAAALAGTRADRDLSDCAAYRSGLDLIRAAVGPQGYVLGCGAPMLPSVGKVDAMRVSADTAPHWRSPTGDLSLAAGESAALAARGRAYQHGRFWVNDPDCLLARPGVERRADRAALIERFGGLRGSSDRIADLDRWGLDTTVRLLSAVPPPSPFPPRPER